MRRPLSVVLFCLAIAITGGFRLASQGLRVATFNADVTPPIGSPLCDALVMPARKIVDRLSARGVAIFGAGRPIVLCAVDWVGIGNGGQDAWRKALADAVGTSVERVCVHTLHPHDAPGCDFEAETLLAEQGLANQMFPVAFARLAIDRTAQALRIAALEPAPFTHLKIGRAEVYRVASNRRILGPDGKVAHVRFSKSGDPKVRAMPEGRIDKWVRVVGFLDGDSPIAVLSYYATHPQSFYGSGGVSPDFVGLARNQCDQQLGTPRWVHFNGAGGDVAAGKYNDGLPSRRKELTERLADGMWRAWQAARSVPITAADVGFETEPVALPASKSLVATELLARLRDVKLNKRERIRAARDLTWLRRTASKRRIDLACLRLGEARILHLPGEAFVAYQLLAQRLRPDLFVCTAAYGDYGPGYIGTAIAYTQGGYETGKVSRVAPAVEGVLRRAIQELLLPATVEFLAGAASVDITPTEPLPLAGYASRQQPSLSVLAKLHAKALALADRDGKRHLLLCADLLGVTKAMSDAICRRLGERFGLPRAAIVIATSHTHTAPVLTDHLAAMYAFDEATHQRVARYTRLVEDRLVEVGAAAMGKLAPASLEWGAGSCDIAVNRRTNVERRVPALRAEQALRGPVDHQVPVLRVRDQTGKVQAIVFGYACHATVLSFRRISGDYAGFAQTALEARNPGAVALFFAGCGGDQNPLPRRSVELAKRYGVKLADSVQAVLTTAMRPIRGSLRATFAETALRFEKLPTESQLRATLNHKNRYERRRAAYLLARIDRLGKLEKSYPYPVQAWQLGDGPSLIALGGEVVVDYSLELKRRLGESKTWVAGYCNDVMAYIPSRRIWHEGGYEGGGAMLYYGQPSRWAESVEDVVMDAAVRAVATVRGRTAPSVKDQLPRTAPRSPDKALETFELAGEHRIELVASEPHVIDPVDMAIDERGRIWVVEMIDYPFDERDGHQPTGRIRILEDVDGDGRVDRSQVFADRLSWPTGLALWKGGVFVAAAPQLLYLRDTNGDGRADRREAVFTGFGRRNVQALLNNMVLQPDGWFYGAGGGNGGKIISSRSRTQSSVLLRGRDFRFHPDGRLEALSGGGQFGHSMDDFGRRFVCNNSDHARHVLFELRYLQRNPALAAPSPLVSIASEGPAGPVFRRSPPEPWRIVRTRWRMAGKVKGPIEHGGAVMGYFTSATGITCYRGTGLGNADGDLFVGDVASNLVHRKRLVPAGVTFRATRREARREFLTSTDIWFRPTNFANGPDGALYICDMYREIVEHPWSLPDSIKAHVDLSSGDDRGRIWRVLDRDAEPYHRPNAAGMTVPQLVERLWHSQGWWRDTAVRLLLERRDTQTKKTLRAAIAQRAGGTATGTSLALRLLHNFGGLGEAELGIALGHPDPALREVGLRLAERLPKTATLRQRVCGLAGDPDSRVRFQAALSLGSFDGPEVYRALASLAERSAGDRNLRTALLTSAGGRRARKLLANLQRDEAEPALLLELSRILGASGEATDRRAVLDWIATEPGFAGPAVRGLAEGMARSGTSFRSWFAGAPAHRVKSLSRCFRVLEMYADSKNAPPARAEAIAELGVAPWDIAGGPLRELLAPEHPPAVRRAAVTALVSYPRPAAAEALLELWPQHTPGLRHAVLRALLRRPAHTSVLVDALARGKIKRSEIPPDIARALRSHRDTSLRERARGLLGAPTGSSRQAVIAKYRPAVRRGGDARRGQLVYQRACKICHPRGAVAKAGAGPDLITVRERSADALLEQILDPNREVNPAYAMYLIETTDDRQIAAAIESEGPTSLTLRRVDGQREVLFRRQIKVLTATGLSLMPEGLEGSIKPTAMADLIAYLRSR